jgi:hypothetical protein
MVLIVVHGTKKYETAANAENQKSVLMVLRHNGCKGSLWINESIWSDNILPRFVQ